MLSLEISTYAIHKAGTEKRHCEDAHAYDIALGRAAVADGASDAFESGPWARLLVASFVHSPPAANTREFVKWLQGRARMWNFSLDWTELPWYAQQKALDVGGLSTLLGFSLNRDASLNGNGKNGSAASEYWQAIAVGDSCLLQIRNKSVVKRFPVENTQAFDNMPGLLATRAETMESLLAKGEALACCSGTCQVGDIFLLATDAVAQWLYSLADLDALGMELQDWEDTLHLVEQDFETLVKDLRARSIMRNDDATLLVLRVVDNSDAAS